MIVLEGAVVEKKERRTEAEGAVYLYIIRMFTDSVQTVPNMCYICNTSMSRFHFLHCR